MLHYLKRFIHLKQIGVSMSMRRWPVQKPSYGHLALATLMHANRTRLVWTTNFDAMVADACAKVYGTTGSLTNVALDAPELGEQAIREDRWPVEVKQHGDFHSRRLKNTAEELPTSGCTSKKYPHRFHVGGLGL